MLISKIGGIKVLQIGDSKVEVSHKSEDGGKVGGFGNQGSNSTIDLGKGKRVNTIKVMVANKADNKALHTILYLVRYTSITDKFRGTNSVYIDKFTKTDSDTHVGVTIYDITYTEQDGAIGNQINFGIRLFSEASTLIGSLTADIENISSMVGFTTGAITDFENGLFQVVDNIKGITDPLFDAVERVRLLKDIKEGLAEVKTSRNRLLDATISIIDFKTPVTNIDADRYQKKIKQSGAKIEGLLRGRSSKGNTLTENLRAVSNYPINEAGRIFKPKIGNRYISESVGYTGIHHDEYICKLHIAYYLNKMKAIRSIKSILLGGYNSRSDFESEVNDTILRLHNIGKREDEIESLVYSLRAYANMQRYREIFEINVTEYKPLVDVVYSLYGNINNYEEIRDINVFADNDRVKGLVKVYTRDIK